MSRSDDDQIADIVEACAEIATIVRRGKAAWDSDRIARLAVERLLEVVGESGRAMSEHARQTRPEVAWSDIIGLRTVLAHHYHRIDPEQVWIIASVEVERLLQQLRLR